MFNYDDSKSIKENIFAFIEERGMEDPAFLKKTSYQIGKAFCDENDHISFNSARRYAHFYLEEKVEPDQDCTNPYNPSGEKLNWEQLESSARHLVDEENDIYSFWPSGSLKPFQLPGQAIREMKRAYSKFASNLDVLKWSTDKSNSFYNFEECYESWEERAR